MLLLFTAFALPSRLSRRLAQTSRQRRGMDPKSFFEVMGLDSVVKFDAAAGGTAFEVV